MVLWLYFWRWLTRKLMSCDPHPNVIMPCADDTLPVENALAVSGDISFDEEGSLALTAGQTEAEIEFGFQKESAAYVFEYLYVKSTGDGQGFLAHPVEQTTKKFTVEFTGAPINGNCTLYWRVKVPDGLHSCPSLQNSPKYAIVPESQHGVASFPVDQDFIEVLFDEEMPSADWGFDQRDIENGAVDIPQVFGEPTLVVRSTVGFTLQYASHPEESGYNLRWKVSDRSVLE